MSSWFLIALPTRNRTEVALKSLQALVRTPLPDHVTVLISDNSDALSPELQTFCEAHGFDYVRPPEVLPIPEHWSWITNEFAFETFAIVTDRSYFNVPRLLEIDRVVRETRKVVSFDAVDYTEATRFGQPVWMISSRLMSGRAFEVPCAALTARLPAQIFERPLPRLMTSVIHADHLRRMEETFPSPLGLYTPDFGFGYRYILSQPEDSVLFLDEAVFASHTKAVSTSNYSKSGASASALDFFALNKTPVNTDAGLPSPYDMVSRELNQALAELGEGPLIDEAILRQQEARWTTQLPRGLRRRLNTLRAILGLSDEISVQVGRGSLVPGFDFSRLRYVAGARTFLDDPRVRETAFPPR